MVLTASRCADLRASRRCIISMLSRKVITSCAANLSRRRCVDSGLVAKGDCDVVAWVDAYLTIVADRTKAVLFLTACLTVMLSFV